MLQSFEIWCENCVKTTYYENEKIFNDEDFVKINNGIELNFIKASCLFNN